MALGIDIYRYQTVTDWNAVKRHGVSFVYVKATDGGSPAIVRADNQVRGAQSVGIPVGLYHYAQLTPSPEAQADVLTGEVRRLGATGLPPALDFEDPWSATAAGHDFISRFLNRLFANGFKHVTFYANASTMNALRAHGNTWFLKDPRVVVWAAAYGANDGKRHPLGYVGKVDIHQYTSVGSVPGITGRVDLNELLIPIGDNDMPDINLNQKLKFWDGFEITLGQALADSWQLANNISDRPTRPNQPADPPPWVDKLIEVLPLIPAMQADIAELKARPTATVDTRQLAADLVEAGYDGVSEEELVAILNRPHYQATTQPNGE